MALRSRYTGAVLAVLAVLLGWAGTAQGQGAARPDGGGEWVVALDAGAVQRFAPILKLEASLAPNGTCEEDCGRQLRGVLVERHLPAAGYAKFKSSLQIARGDVVAPRRLEGLAAVATRLRRGNVTMYRQHAAELAPALATLAAQPGCALCAPVQQPSGGTRR